MASSAQSVTTLATERRYIQVPDTGCQQIQSIQVYVGSTDSNSITPLSKEWLSLRRYSRNLHTFNKVLWTSPKPHLIHIGRKMHDTSVEFRSLSKYVFQCPYFHETHKYCTQS
jgi:hypothetical protein